MSRILKPRFVSDFETIVNEKKTKVWLWGAVSFAGEDFAYGTDIESYIEFISRISCITYFHNLKFDSQFIIYWLMKNGYEHTAQRNPRPGHFTTLISDMGVFYNMKVAFRNGSVVTFYDSLKEIPLPVRDIPKAFGLDIEKLDMEYDSVKYEDEHEPTEKEIEYVKHDCLVVKRGLEHNHAAGLKNHTAASNALANFKKTCSKSEYRNRFPALSISADLDCRKAYKGGWTYLNPKYQNTMIGVGRVYDVNSMYPWAMRECSLPYGTPIYFQGKYEEDDIYPLYIQCIRFTFHVKQGFYPCIQIKGSPRFLETEYLTDSDEPVIITVTNVDLKLIMDSYDIPFIEYLGGYKFRRSTAIFRSYIDYWYEQKKQATIDGNVAMRTIAKLMLNSLYGKFAKNPIQRSKYPVYDEENDLIRYEYGPQEETSPLYVPIAAFITSYCRDKIIRAADAAGDRFIYADTDSLHVLGDADLDIDVDPVRLGAFKHESTFTRAKYLRPKCYIEEIDGKLDKKCAGLPVDARELLNFDTLEYGAVFTGKLQFKVVPGGAVLVNREYSIKDVK